MPATHLTTIEINGTFYRTQSAASFAKWRDETPDDFVFSVKGHRAVVNRKDLGRRRRGDRLVLRQSGFSELGDKLGPILWQFAPFKKFDAGDFGGFLALLPRELDGRRLMHVVEVRSETFLVPEFVDLLRKHEVAVVYAELRPTIRRSPMSPRPSSISASSAPTRPSTPATPPAISTAGPSGRSASPAATCRTISSAIPRRRRRKSSATSSSTLSPAPRCARRRRRWR